MQERFPIGISSSDECAVALGMTHNAQGVVGTSSLAMLWELGGSEFVHLGTSAVHLTAHTFATKRKLHCGHS